MQSQIILQPLSTSHWQFLKEIFFVKHLIIQVYYLTYSPDPAQTDFSFFRTKNSFSGERFGDVEGIKRNKIVQLHTVWKEGFQGYFDQSKNHWNDE